MDPWDNNPSSGSAVERNVIDFLAHRKSATNVAVHGIEVEKRSDSGNRPRMQPLPGRSYLCTNCGQPFLDYADLEVHTRVCDSEDQGVRPRAVVNKQLSCQICGKKYGDINSLEAHMKMQHSGRSDAIHRDHEKGDSNSFSVHLKMNGSNQKISISSTDSTVVSNSIVTVIDAEMEEIQRGEKLYRCSACGLSNDKTANLYKHMKNAHPKLSIVHKRVLCKKNRETAQINESNSNKNQHSGFKVSTPSKFVTCSVKQEERQQSQNYAIDDSANLGCSIEMSDDISLPLLYQCSLCNLSFFDKSEHDKHHRKSHEENKSLWDYSMSSATVEGGSVTVTGNFDQSVGDYQPVDLGYKVVVTETSPVNESGYDGTVNSMTGEICLETINSDVEVMIVRSKKRGITEDVSLTKSIQQEVEESLETENDIIPVDLNSIGVIKVKGDENIVHLDGKDTSGVNKSHGLSNNGVTRSKVSCLSFQEPVRNAAPWTSNVADTPEKQRNKRAKFEKLPLSIESLETSFEDLNTVKVVDVVGNGRHRYKCSACDVTSHCTSNLYQHMRTVHKNLAIAKKRKGVDIYVPTDIGNDDDEDDEYSLSNRIVQKFHNGHDENDWGNSYRADLNISRYNDDKHLSTIKIKSGKLKANGMDRLESGRDHCKEKTVHVIDIPKAGSHRYQCSACLRTAGSTGGLYDHMRRVHKGFRILFKSGGEEAAGNEDEMDEITGDNNVKDLAEKPGYNSSHEENDVLNVIDVPVKGGCVFRCSKCDSMCNNLSNMYKHMRRMHRGMRIAQRIRKRRRTALEMSLPQTDRNEGGVTVICNGTNGYDDDSRDSILTENVEDVSSEDEAEQYECSKCSQSFPSAEKLLAHTMRAHKTTRSSQKLRTRNGLAEKRPKSSNSSVRDKSELNDKHNSITHKSSEIVTVIDIAPTKDGHRFKCSECGESYRYVSSVQRHMRTMHKGMTLQLHRKQYGMADTPEKDEESDVAAADDNDRNFSSNDINDSSDSEPKLESRQTKLVHKFKCSRCDFMCRNARSLDKHMRRMHKGVRKRGRKSKSLEEIVVDNEPNFTESVDVGDKDGGSEFKKRKTRRTDHKTSSPSKAIDDMDCDAKQKCGNEKVGLPNGAMEKIQREGVTMLNMPNIMDNEANVVVGVNVADERQEIDDVMTSDDNQDYCESESDGDMIYSVDTAIDTIPTKINCRKSKKRSVNSFGGSNASKIVRTDKMVKSKRLRKGSRLICKFQGNRNERTIGRETKIEYGTPLNEQDFNPNDLGNGGNVVRPILITAPGGVHKYKCSECGLTCNVASNLYKHMRTVHRGMTVIQRKPSRKSVLDESEINPRHVLENVNRSSDTVQIIEIPPTKDGHKFKCSRCDVICRDSSNMYKHMRRMHRGLRVICRKRGRGKKFNFSQRSHLDYSFENATSVYAADESETHIKEESRGKSFWDYCLSVATDNLLGDARIDGKVHQDGVTSLNLGTQEESASQGDATIAMTDDAGGRYEVTVMGSLDHEQHDHFQNEDRLLVDDSSNRISSVNNSNNAEVQQSNITVTNIDLSAPAHESANSNTDKSKSKGGSACKTLDSNSNNNNSSLLESGSVRVIDIPAGRGRLKYKCSKCELVCNEIGNMYKHIRRMHKDLVFIPRARKNKAWYLKLCPSYSS